MPDDGSRQDQPIRSLGGSGTVTFRPRVAHDDDDIVAIYNRQEADSMPLTLARYRLEQAEQAANRRGKQWVALEKGHVVGVGALSHAWWTGESGSYAVHLSVDQPRRRQGIGGGLIRVLQADLHLLGATRLLDWVRADAEDGRRFAAALGFRETGECLDEYQLHVSAATTDGYAGLESCLTDEGIRIASLAELGPDDVSLLRALQQLWADSGDSSADSDRLVESFPSWQREVLDSVGLSAETHWVAIDGERPVGMAFLKRLNEDAAENDYTCVAATHRGRGIATALKLRTIAWARRHGVHRLFTSSEIENTPMIAITRRLGYQAGVRRLAVARDLS